MTDTRLNFKDMCAKFDVTPRTLRYYEYIELLQPEREGRSRFYSAREIARMTLIMRGPPLGLSSGRHTPVPAGLRRAWYKSPTPALDRHGRWQAH